MIASISFVRKLDHVPKKKYLRTRKCSCGHVSGAPNDNIVQNRFNVALLNVFQYLNGRYRHIFIP